MVLSPDHGSHKSCLDVEVRELLPHDTTGQSCPLLQELPRFVAFSADPGSAAVAIHAILKWTAGANRDLHQQVMLLLVWSLMPTL